MLNLTIPETMQELTPKITVIGVGGAGGNAVNNMIESNLEGVEFVVANTDGQALSNSLTSRKLQLGQSITKGLGAGSKPDVGRAAAEESMADIMSELGDSNMVFITAGLGGGTGTGAAPIIAKASRERGILTVCVVTKPFDFEGAHRKRIAEEGIEEIQKHADTLIVIPNQNLFRLANERTGFAEAFGIADNVLHKGVCGVTDLMVKPGLINLDFADIRTVMSEMGKAMMGTGEASGDKRAIEAAESAINNPLLDEITMKGAKAVLINITGGKDMTLFEVDEATNRIRSEIDPNANIIFGSALDENIEGLMRVSVVATGISAENISLNKTNSVFIHEMFPNKQNLNNDHEKNSGNLDERPIIQAQNNKDIDESKDIPNLSQEIIYDQTKDDSIDQNKTDKLILNLEKTPDQCENLELKLENSSKVNNGEILNQDIAIDSEYTDQYFIPEKSIEIPDISPEQEITLKEETSQTIYKNNQNKKENSSLIDRISGFWANKSSIKNDLVTKENGNIRISKSINNSANKNSQTEMEIQSENAEDKILEIPAFLRRQAN